MKHSSRKFVRFLSFVRIESVCREHVRGLRKHSIVPEENRRAKTVTFCDLDTVLSSILNNLNPGLLNLSNLISPCLRSSRTHFVLVLLIEKKHRCVKLVKGKVEDIWCDSSNDPPIYETQVTFASCGVLVERNVERLFEPHDD